MGKRARSSIASHLARPPFHFLFLQIDGQNLRTEERLVKYIINLLSALLVCRRWILCLTVSFAAI